MRNLLLLTTLLLSSAASAQVSVSLKLATGQTTLRFGPKDCADRPVTVNWTKTGNVCADLTLWLTRANADCGDSPGVGDVTLTSVPLSTLQSSATGPIQFNLNQARYPNADTDGGSVDCTTVRDELTFRLCGATKGYAGIYDASCSSTVTKATPMQFVFDGQPPAAPTIESASGLDQAVQANVSEPTGASQLELVVSRDGSVVKSVTQVVGKGPIRVDGLANEVTYQLVAYAFDEAGNQSAPSETKDATPIKTNGFFEEYVNAHGEERGGCGAAGGGVAGSAVLAALGFWLSSRRNRS